MDDLVTVEYRGILGTLGTLAVGSAFVVESCEAGVLRLRAAPIAALVSTPVSTPVTPTAEPSAQASDMPSKDE